MMEQSTPIDEMIEPQLGDVIANAIETGCKDILHAALARRSFLLLGVTRPDNDIELLQ